MTICSLQRIKIIIIELGCGTPLRHVLSYSEVHCVTLSRNRKNPDQKNVLEEQLIRLSVLGIPRE